MLFLSGFQLYGQIPYNINSYGGELEGTDFKVYFEVGAFASGQISGNQLQLSHILHPVFDKKTNVLSIPDGNDIIKVYPNPFISEVNIESAEESFDQVVVISLMGEIVISKNTGDSLVATTCFSLNVEDRQEKPSVRVS